MQVVLWEKKGVSMRNFRSSFVIVLFFFTTSQVNAEWLELISDDKRSVFIETDLIIPYLTDRKMAKELHKKNTSFNNTYSCALKWNFNSTKAFHPLSTLCTMANVAMRAFEPTMPR